jgi:hypothetical protein
LRGENPGGHVESFTKTVGNLCSVALGLWYGEILDDLEIGERINARYELDELLSHLHESGWKLFGSRSTRRLKLREDDQGVELRVFLGVVTRSGAESVSWYQYQGDRFVVHRPRGKEEAADDSNEG